MNLDPSTLQQRWPLPSDPRPIVSVGAGDVVRTAHLPAYAMAGLPVAGVFDVQPKRSRSLADQFGIPRVFDSLSEALTEKEVVFDIAVPPEYLLDIVRQLPEGAVVLMQKPMGVDLASAREIARACREKELVAAVNFQLRFSPVMLAAADLLGRGLLGTITDFEVHMNFPIQWHLFPFLKKEKRVDMLIGSIHYFDLARSILGQPQGVYARSIPHPKHPDIESTRTSAILDYGTDVRCCLSLNNCWSFGGKVQACTLRVEGLDGAVVASLDSLIDTPDGGSDKLEFITSAGDWTAVPIAGNWFPDAFSGTMCNLQRFAAGEDDRLPTRIDDALQTMAMIEALYQSSEDGAIPIPE